MKYYEIIVTSQVIVMEMNLFFQTFILIMKKIRF